MWSWPISGLHCKDKGDYGVCTYYQRIISTIKNLPTNKIPSGYNSEYQKELQMTGLIKTHPKTVKGLNHIDFVGKILKYVMTGYLSLVPIAHLCYKLHPIPLCSLLYQSLLRKEFGISDLNLNVAISQTYFFPRLICIYGLIIDDWKALLTINWI